MISRKRLTRIETALSPDAAVLLWLEKEYRNKTLREYARSLAAGPVCAAPRIHIENQAAAATRNAMRGQESSRIDKAVLQTRMDTDFLIMLVSRTLSVIQDCSLRGWLLFTSALMTGLLEKQAGDGEADEVETNLRRAVVELLSVSGAVERIQNQYFDGKCILPKDFKMELEEDTMGLECLIKGVDKDLKADRHFERMDTGEFRAEVDTKASETARRIAALAKSCVFERFGMPEKANAVLKPYVLADE